MNKGIFHAFAGRMCRSKRIVADRNGKVTAKLILFRRTSGPKWLIKDGGARAVSSAACARRGGCRLNRVAPGNNRSVAPEVLRLPFGNELLACNSGIWDSLRRRLGLLRFSCPSSNSPRISSTRPWRCTYYGSARDAGSRFLNLTARSCVLRLYRVDLFRAEPSSPACGRPLQR